MATFKNTIMAFTKADSFVPLMRRRVKASNITSAGALIIPDAVCTCCDNSGPSLPICSADNTKLPWCKDFPASSSVAAAFAASPLKYEILSKGEWHHSYGMAPPSKLFKYSLHAMETVAAPSAYSITNAHPMIQATSSPMVTNE